MLGFFDYFEIFRARDKFLLKLPEEKKYMSLAISGISICFLLLVIPIWAIQIINIFKEKSKPKVESHTKVSSYSFGEVSDTGSMLIRPSSDWNPTSFTNQASFLIPKHFLQTKSSCCCYVSVATGSETTSSEKKM